MAGRVQNLTTKRSRLDGPGGTDPGIGASSGAVTGVGAAEKQRQNAEAASPDPRRRSVQGDHQQDNPRGYC